VAIMAAREKWTDERLDDLNKKVDDGFHEMREEFRALRGEMKAGFDRVNGQFDRVNEQMLAMQRTILQLFGGMIATMLVGFLAVIATILTQS
jgi:hypothetical protein